MELEYGEPTVQRLLTVVCVKLYYALRLFQTTPLKLITQKAQRYLSPVF